jgi:tetratricopeptide (TPR) repeat protein
LGSQTKAAIDGYNRFMRARRWALLPVAAFALVGLAAQPQGNTGQSGRPPAENPRSGTGQSRTDLPANSAAPRSDDESSSNGTRIDLAPPKADELAHPDGGRAAGDAMGTHEWNPLRAMKDVEVGEFYYKAANYKAALSRFREALEYKPGDAVATFKLAQTLEKSGEFAEARAQYEAYLAILNDGPNATDARKGLQRLSKR